ncbi:MAG: hypothetical protein NWS01_08500 [Burkholderiales bacterium]|nr:hypothetical protein [Burkholderiales bacterium]
MANSRNLLDQLGSIVGAQNTLVQESDQEKYVRDWFGRMKGQALAVVRPGSTSQVADVVKVCQSHLVPVVHQ